MLVTPDNFKRAETDMYFAMFVKRGALGTFIHFRELPLEGTGVRPNRDTLYSQAVFDLDAGPVTITLPNAGKRFMSMQVIDQDHYAHETVYAARDYTYTREQVGTRYVFIAASALWSTRPIPRTSSRFTRSKMRSRSSNQAARAASRRRTGIRRARNRCAMHSWSWLDTA